jgi:glycosyltransferase involved in cell wall biosynthesis
VISEVGFTVQLGVLICTRNRPEHLENLLQSLSNSSTKPKEIVLISSGTRVENIVSNFSKNLNLTHIHTEKSGQSNQKVIGFKSFKSNVDWVFFLDDDLLLKPDTINNAMRVINRNEGRNIGGIGAKILSLQNNSVSNESNSISKQVRRVGKIQSSGRATKYMFDQQIETEWLNGVSIWKYSNLAFYDLPILDSRYAAYEDVIFSSNIAKNSVLLYEPSIEVYEQINHSQKVINLSQFKYISLWTGYLVCIRDATKLNKFKILTFFRSIIFLKNIAKFERKSLSNLTNLALFTLKIFVLSNNKIDARNRIIQLINEEGISLNKFIRS